MTKAAQHFGKALDDFWRNAEAKEYILALGAIHIPKTPANVREYEESKGRYVETKAGRNGGTWAHPKLAIFFAR